MKHRKASVRFTGTAPVSQSCFLQAPFVGLVAEDQPPAAKHRKRPAEADRSFYENHPPIRFRYCGSLQSRFKSNLDGVSRSFFVFLRYSEKEINAHLPLHRQCSFMQVGIQCATRRKSTGSGKSPQFSRCVFLSCSISSSTAIKRAMSKKLTAPKRSLIYCFTPVMIYSGNY